MILTLTDKVTSEKQSYPIRSNEDFTPIIMLYPEVRSIVFSGYEHSNLSEDYSPRLRKIVDDVAEYLKQYNLEVSIESENIWEMHDPMNPFEKSELEKKLWEGDYPHGATNGILNPDLADIEDSASRFAAIDSQPFKQLVGHIQRHGKLMNMPIGDTIHFYSHSESVRSDPPIGHSRRNDIEGDIQQAKQKPIIVGHNNGEYMVLDGQHRFNQHHHDQSTHIPVLMVDLSKHPIATSQWDFMKPNLQPYSPRKSLGKAETLANMIIANLPNLIKNAPNEFFNHPEVKNMLHNEVKNMHAEVQNSVQGQRSGFQDNLGNNVNTTTNSTFPAYYSKIGVKNKAHFEQVMNAKKGPIYQRMLNEAHDRLLHGYSNHHGYDLPNPKYLIHAVRHGVIPLNDFKEKMKTIDDHAERSIAVNKKENSKVESFVMAASVLLALTTTFIPSNIAKAEVNKQVVNVFKYRPYGHKPEDKFLQTIMELESSSGMNVNHREPSCVGRWGLMAPTIKDMVRLFDTHNDDTKNFINLDAPQLKQIFKKYPALELHVARILARYVIAKHKGDMARAAYAWKNGQNIPNNEITDEMLANEPYIQKFTDISGKFAKSTNLEFDQKLKEWIAKRKQKDDNPELHSPSEPDYSKIREPDPTYLRDTSKLRANIARVNK